MGPDVTTITSYKYDVVPDNAYGTPFARRAAMVPHAASGVCKPTGVVKQACAAHRDYGWPWPDNKYCDDYYATEYECSADLPIAMQVSPVTGASWHATGSTNQIVTRSEAHTSELQSLMRTSYAVFCLKKNKQNTNKTIIQTKTKNNTPKK